MAEITLNWQAYEAALTDLERTKLPLLQKIVIEKLVYETYDAQKAKLDVVFDRPTPYTMNALRKIFPRRAGDEGKVFFKTDTHKGTPAPKYLMPQVKGGSRRYKRHEVLLRNIGALPSGWFCRPGPDAAIDAYGNQSRGQIVRILSFLQAFPQVGYRMNMTAEKRAKLAAQNREYFVIKPGDYSRRKGGVVAPGIWRNNGKRAKPMLIIQFIKTPTYRKRYPFYEIAEQIAKTRFEEKAMQAYRKVFSR